MDPFVEVPFEKWPLIQNKLRMLWPLNVAGYYALDNSIKYSTIREAFKFKVFCVDGGIEKGFVAETIKGNCTEYIIFPINEDTKPLEEAILKTKLIKWTELIVIDLVTSVTMKILENILPPMKLKLCRIGRVKTYFLDRNTKLFDGLRCPPDTYLAALNQDHIRRADETWPYRHDGSYFYFSVLADTNLAHGMFSVNRQLLAWVFLNEYNFVCHLYCEEDYRRKGYAEYLMKCVINYELAKGNDVYTYVENDNEKSSGLFDKLGFVDIDNGGYMYIQK